MYILYIIIYFLLYVIIIASQTILNTYLYIIYTLQYTVTIIVLICYCLCFKEYNILFEYNKRTQKFRIIILLIENWIVVRLFKVWIIRLLYFPQLDLLIIIYYSLKLDKSETWQHQRTFYLTKMNNFGNNGIFLILSGYNFW